MRTNHVPRDTSVCRQPPSVPTTLVLVSYTHSTHKQGKIMLQLFASVWNPKYTLTLNKLIYLGHLNVQEIKIHLLVDHCNQILRISFTAGFYNDEKNATSQTFCKLCPEGQYCPRGSVTGQTCPAGFYCTEGQMTGFQNACPIGTYSSTTGLNSRDNFELYCYFSQHLK